MSIVVTYHCAEISPDGTAPLGRIEFSGVQEFRWIESDVLYEEHDRHQDDYEFGLIEVVDSKYIETMRMRQPVAEQSGQPRPVLPEFQLRHFRMGFDDWGELNVFATEVNVTVDDCACPSGTTNA